jgi:hypothetical protein
MIQNILGAIPMAMNTINSLSTLIRGPYVPPKVYNEDSREVFSQGGKLRGHYKYDAPSHAQGGQTVNKDGIPMPDQSNEIEGKESKYTFSRIKDGTYIYTPEDTKKVDKIIKKYKDADSNSLSKNAMEIEMNRLAQNNEMRKKKLNQASTKKYSEGGKIKKYNFGGILGSPGNGLLQLSGMLEKIKQGDFSGIHMNTSSSNPTGTPAVNPLPANTKTGNTPQVTPKEPIDLSGVKGLDTLRTIGMIGNATQLFSRAETEDPIMADYGKVRKNLNELDANYDPMREQAQQSSNVVRDINRGAATSYQGFAAREAQRVANLTQTMSQLGAQEIQANNQIASTKANVESQIAASNQGTLIQNRINNQMNEAQTRNIKRGISTDILAEIDRRSTIENDKSFAEMTTKEGLALMNTMFPDFGVDANTVMIMQKKMRGEKLTAEETKIIEEMNLVNFK